MSATEHRFRTAAFGFNRQDVMQYIEAVHKDYAAKIKSVKGELERERDQRSSLEEKGSLASSEAQAAEKAAQRSREELEEVRQTLLEVQKERDTLRLAACTCPWEEIYEAMGSRPVWRLRPRSAMAREEFDEVFSSGPVWTLEHVDPPEQEN